MRRLLSSLSQNLQNETPCYYGCALLKTKKFGRMLFCGRCRAILGISPRKGLCLKTLRCLSMSALLLKETLKDYLDGVEQHVVYKYFSPPGSTPPFNIPLAFFRFSKNRDVHAVARCFPFFFNTSKTTLVQYYGLGVFSKSNTNVAMFAAFARPSKLLELFNKDIMRRVMSLESELPQRYVASRRKVARSGV